MADMLIVRDLVKRYGDGSGAGPLSFSVSHGQIFALLGKNGAGKTTTIECIVGLRRCDSGDINVGGVDVTAEPRRARQDIGVQLQSTALQEKITPREALNLFASFYSRRASVDALLRRFDLEDKSNSPFDTLSGGQRQRLALALAFVNEPKIVFLDEPTAGLDAQSRREFHALIRDMREEGRTIVLSTHYIDEAEALCDSLAIMHRGTIVAMGKPSDLIAGSGTLSRITLRLAKAAESSFFLAIPGVGDASIRDGAWQINCSALPATLGELTARLQAVGNQLLELQVAQRRLEDVFIELTGTAPESLKEVSGSILHC